MTARQLRRPGLLLLTLHLSGCATWQPPSTGLVATLEGRPSEVRLTLLSGETHSVRWPTLRGDSIGTLDESCRTAGPDGLRCSESWRPVAAVADVARVETHQFQLGRTLGLTAVVILGVVALPYIGYALAGPQS